MKRLPRTLLGLALVAGVVGLPAAPVRAEVTVSFTPSVLDLDGEAGEGTVTIQVTNEGDEPYAAAVVVQDDLRAPADRSAAGWVSVAQDRVELGPGESAGVEVTIAVPRGAESGGRYAGISFATAAEDKPEGEESRVGISARIIVPVRLAVAGDGEMVFKATADRFAPVLEPDGRIGFRAEVSNAGNVHAKLGGEIGIGLEGQEQIASIAFSSATVLPAETVLLSTEGTLPLPAGRQYEATAEFASVEGAETEPVSAAASFGTEPELALGTATVCENLDRGPTVTGALANNGTIGVLPQVAVELRGADGAPLGSTQVQTDAVAWPNEAVDLTVDLPEALAGGEYTVVTRVAYGYQQTIEQETAFQIGGDPATAAPLCENPFLEAASPEAAPPEAGA